MSINIRVALIYQQEAATTNLRAALANAGVEIGIECKADALDAPAVLASGVDAIIINLDSELEDLLDDVAGGLENAAQPVIFNDPAASSDLSGWDRARWMRHLAAKLKGRSDVTPPAPPGAQAIPMPAAKPLPPKVEAPVPPQPAVEVASVAVLAPTPAPVMPASGVATAAPVEQVSELDLSSLDDLLFGEQPAAVAPIAAADPQFDEMDALFASAELAAPVGDVSAGDDLDLDSLFDSPSPPDAPQSAAQTGAASAVVSDQELADLDALFSEFVVSSEGAPAAVAPAAAIDAAPTADAAPPTFSLDWSLEPLDTPEAPAVPVDKMVAEWRLDAPSPAATANKPAAVPAAEKPKAEAARSPKLPEHLEQSLALADFSLLDDFAAEPAAPAVHAVAAPDSGLLLEDLGSMDLSGIDFDAGLSLPDNPEPANAPALSMDESISLSDLDFEIDLGDLHGSSPANSSFGAELNDLDSLFEPVTSTPVIGLSMADLNRLFILGASIGGPEAIKAFLAKLPADIPAAFIVAQHMGADFLQMMATQLDSATQLAVRCPQSGERVRHGQVLVAPATERMAIDDTGVVRLSAPATASPYNPSIDQIVRDAVDRFGDQVTLILFSGMGTDALDGGRYLTERGGQVWAQDRSTCVIASMIEAAKSQGLVRFEGNPAQLAERVLQVLA